MHLSRPDVADTAVARRRLELLTHGTDDEHGPDVEAAAAGDADADPAGSDDTTRAPAEPSAPGRHAARGVSARDRLSARLLDALPPTLRGRWGVTAHHVTVLALLVASSVALAAWWLVRAQPEPLPAMTASQGASRDESAVVAQGTTAGQAGARQAGVDEGGAGDAGAGDAGAGDAGAEQGAEEPAELVVHVAGKVKEPGIVSLPPGARVIEALQEAGGPRKGVDLSSLNLARALSDGEQIVVGIQPTAPAGSTSGAPGSSGGDLGRPVNLNTATSDQLEELPGVGPVTAASILDWREEHGRFSTVEELLEVSGIGEATLADLRELVTV